MRTSKFALAAACAAMLASCGGGGSSGGPIGGTPTPTPAPTPTPSPTPTTAACSLQTRKEWTLAQFQQYYLFPSLLNTSVSTTNSTETLQDFIDLLVKPARDQGKDRYFSYITSIAEENAYYEQGASAGFGFRLGYTTSGHFFVTEAYEGGPSLGQNVDRGSEILSIGTNGSNMVAVTTLYANGGYYGVIDALGPDTTGTTRTMLVRDAGGVERTVTLTKSEFDLDPVSDRYGYKIVDSGGKKVGYINLRTFIDPAVPDLETAFAAFRDAGVTELVIDMRYNGGGLLSVAAEFGDLMGRDLAGEVFARISYNPSNGPDDVYKFAPTAQSIQPTKIAFITSHSTASASELVINAMLPYLDPANVALIGDDTYGKPVGQIAIDKAACDDRLRVIAFQLENADGNGEYFDGLASSVGRTCVAYDDISKQLGDPTEQMFATALGFLNGASCTPIAGVATTQRVSGRQTLVPRQPNTIQRENPGVF